jgi:hypothetical protein
VWGADREPSVAKQLGVAALQLLELEPVGVSLSGNERLGCIHLQVRDRDLACHSGFRMARGFV